MKNTVRDYGFKGGSAVIMDVITGEILSLTSFPEYDSAVITDGSEVELINSILDNESKPLLNRVVSGAYIPGSIIKPYLAYGALSENIIDPLKQIESL